MEPIPPIVRELFALLPPLGDEFPMVERIRWLRTADAILRLLYKDDEVQLEFPFESKKKRYSGQKGGHARANALTPERRSEIASIAATKRWNNTNHET